MWQQYNPNPTGRVNVGDCAVRAVAKALDVSWEDAYALIAAKGYLLGDVISSDAVWGSVLRSFGFSREAIPNTCPECYTAADFCRDNPRGVFVLGFGGHAAAVVDGILYDSWDSSDIIPVYVWRKDDLNGI